MNKMQEQVEEFHECYAVPVGVLAAPKLLTHERATLRVALIKEELEEYELASEQHNLIECADALGDLLYVVFGAAVEHGFDMEPVVDAIHKSNLSKLDTEGKPIYGRLGKVMKGPNYQPPDIKGALKL